MGVISFSEPPTQSWGAAGWAFRQVLDDIAALYPEDEELRAVFDRAKAYDALMVEMLPTELARKVVESMRHTLTGILDGTIKSGITSKPFFDGAAAVQFESALRELLSMIPESVGDTPR